MRDTIQRFFIISFILVIMAACAPQPPVPEDNYYRLSTANMQPIPKVLTTALSVSHFATDGLHSERALLYSEAGTPMQLRQYHYHHWIDSPPRLIQEHIISALRAAHVAETVVNYDPANRAGLQLSGKIRSFEHRRSGNNATVIIDMEFRLDDASRKLVFLRDYRVEKAASSANPVDLVVVYSETLQQVYEMFLTDWQSSKH